MEKVEPFKGWKLRDEKAVVSANFELLTKNTRGRGEFLPPPPRLTTGIGLIREVQKMANIIISMIRSNLTDAFFYKQHLYKQRLFEIS